MNIDGTVLAVCVSALVSGRKGAVRVFKLVSDVWTQEGVITNPVNTTTGSFASSVAFNSNNSKIMVSDPTVTVNGQVNAGVIYNFSYSFGNVEYLNSFSAAVPVAEGYFGQVIWASTNFSRFTTTTPAKAYIFG